MQLLGSCLGNPRRCGHQDGAAKRQRDVFQHHGHLKERRPGRKVPAAQPVPWGECPPSPASAPSINPFVSPQKSSNYGRKSSLPLEVPPPQTVTLLTLAGGGTFRNARKIWGGGGRRHPGSNLLPPAASPPLSPAHPIHTIRISVTFSSSPPPVTSPGRVQLRVQEDTALLHFPRGLDK